MKVRMISTISGTRDGVVWPPAGDTLDVPDTEGANLCSQGFAEPVAEVPAPKKATARKAEKRG